MFLSHSEPLFGFGKRKSCDSFRALDALDVALGAVFNVVEDYIVTARVDRLILVQEVNVVLDVSFQTCKELRLENDVSLLRFGNFALLCLRTATFIVWLL